MNRKRQQGDIIFAFGQFIGPVLKIAENPAAFDDDEKARIFARFFHDATAFNNLLSHFCLEGEPGHRYQIQFQRVQQQLNLILATGRKHDDPSMLAVAEEVHGHVLESLLSIPIPLDSSIHEARTPFSTYCFVRDLCATAKAQVTWLDRYFDHTLFHRFLAGIPPSVQTVLVTLPASAARGAADARRVAEFMDLSKMFAAERGPAAYRLLANSNFHDRWLRCDGALFTLGGSIKDLSRPFTIGRLDSTPDNHKQFDDAIVSATEVFGPTQTTHP